MKVVVSVMNCSSELGLNDTCSTHVHVHIFSLRLHRQPRKENMIYMNCEGRLDLDHAAWSYQGLCTKAVT